MSYLTPEELQRILKRVFYEDDIGRNLDYVGGHRWRTMVYESGSVTVGPGASVTTLSVSGIGYQRGWIYQESDGIPAAYARHEFNVDGQGYKLAGRHGFMDIGFANWTEVTAKGWYANRVFVKCWDTAVNKYELANYFVPRTLDFRTSLAARLRNTHPTDSSTQTGHITYSLFVSSKRILCKLPKFIDAPELRKKAGSRDLAHPIVVERLGYFEKEEEHPYRDYLADLPNEWDTERTLPDGTVVRGASPAKAKTVLTLIVPEDWDAKRALGKIKPEKVLSEE